MRKRDLLFVTIAICTALVFAGHLLVKNIAAATTASWGLSFRTEGAAPVAPASNRELARLSAAYLGDTTQKTIYLTFDAGYENGCTAQILDILKKHNVPAAFFLVGTYMQTHPDLVRRMTQEGHIVGNHTMHHPDMSKISDEGAFAKELSAVETLYKEITGQEMAKFYRPPQGVYSAKNLEMAQKMGYKTVFWSLAYVDWNNDSQPTAEYAFSKLLPRSHNGMVVLLHSTSKTNAQILDELLTRWKEMGYSFAPITDLFPAGDIG